MKKHPLLMALLVVSAIFLFFVVATFVMVLWGGRGESFALGEKVGVIEVSGVIGSSRQVVENILQFRDDDAVKGVVLRIDSPGGGVGPSQEIYEEVGKLTKVKPVVVSMGAVAASGGYYIAAPADVIFANPGTITGSIGVIMEFANVQELLDKIGLSAEVVKSGKHKDIGSPVRPMSTDDRKILQALIDDVYQQFVSAVAEGRGLAEEEVRKIADGRIFSGRQAQEYGLVDVLGNLQDAIAEAGRRGGIAGEPKVVYLPEERRGLLRYLIEESAVQLRRGIREEFGSGLRFLWNSQEV